MLQENSCTFNLLLHLFSVYTASGSPQNSSNLCHIVMLFFVDEPMRLGSTASPTSESHLRFLAMNGCFNASFGVIRFSGLSAKQRSSRSVNKANSLVSMSFRPFAADMRRVRISRVGFEKARVLIVSCRENGSANDSF